MAVCRYQQCSLFWSCKFIKIVTADFLPRTKYLFDRYVIVAQFNELNFFLALRALVVLIIVVTSGSLLDNVTYWLCQSFI